MKFVFFDHAKNMSIAHWSFMMGNLLSVICGLRVMIRTMQFLQGPHPWDPWKRPADPITGFILGIKLRNTLALELVGLAIGIPAVFIAVMYLAPIQAR